MSNDLRIVFMGTPEFAVETLSELVERKLNVVGVVTAPDRPAGRGQKLRESAVKRFARERGLPILQPTNLKNEHFLTALRVLNPNLQIVVAFRMLPKVVWQLPALGTFNLHASLLPDYRGAAPINWAIINGETKTGVTTFFIDEKIDTGAVILQQETDIKQNDNAGSLHDRLMKLGSKLAADTVEMITAGNAEPKVQQEHDRLHPAPKLNKDNCRIDWNSSLETIRNLIRGLSPYPAAWCVLKNGNDEISCKIFDVDIHAAKHNHANGHIVIDDSVLKVAAKEGFLVVKDLQLSGKRRMDAKSLLNGFQFLDGSKML